MGKPSTERSAFAQFIFAAEKANIFTDDNKLTLAIDMGMELEELELIIERAFTLVQKGS